MKSTLKVFIALCAIPWAAAAEPASATESAMHAAGENRSELKKALGEVSAEQRAGMQFLIENMPPVDLRTMKAEFLLNHVDQSYRAMAAAPWAKTVPQEIFLNDVLAYSSLNECRDGSRLKLQEIAASLVKECKTPGEAAQALNQKLFGMVHVKYSTLRKKPDQSAMESMQSGVATCSGLSILLVEACRAVGVPARVVGTPMWTNLRGNHTWVEVWDGDWHFAGAAEPDKRGLDHGWFKGDAAAADNTKAIHRIYASSFKRTGMSFPLVWDPSINWVPAVNVTERYTKATKPAEGQVKLLVRVLDKPGGHRVAANVTVTDAADAKQTFSGISSNDTADLNNILPFQLLPGHTYQVVVKDGDTIVKTEVTLTKEPEQTTSVTFSN